MAQTGQVEMLRSPLVDGGVPEIQGAIPVNASQPQLYSQQPPVLASISQVSPPPQPAQMTTVEVRIPDQAMPGQSIHFSLPSGQPVSVPVRERVEAGSVITVQVPVPQASPAVVSATAIPVTAVRAGHGAQVPLPTITAQQDQQNAQIGWIIYGLGWALCCFMGPLMAFVMWAITAGMFYCKSSEERRNNPRQHAPAKAAAITMGGVCGICTLMGILGAAVMFLVAGMDSDAFQPFGPHNGTRHHHHPHPHPPHHEFWAEQSLRGYEPAGSADDNDAPRFLPITWRHAEDRTEVEEDNSEANEGEADPSVSEGEEDVEDDEDMGTRDRGETPIRGEMEAEPAPMSMKGEGKATDEKAVRPSPLMHLAHAFKKISDPKHMEMLKKHMDKLPAHMVKLLNHTQKLLNHTQHHFQQVVI